MPLETAEAKNYGPKAEPKNGELLDSSIIYKVDKNSDESTPLKMWKHLN